MLKPWDYESLVEAMELSGSKYFGQEEIDFFNSKQYGPICQFQDTVLFIDSIQFIDSDNQAHPRQYKIKSWIIGDRGVSTIGHSFNSLEDAEKAYWQYLDIVSPL